MNENVVARLSALTAAQESAPAYRSLYQINTRVWLTALRA